MEGNGHSGPEKSGSKVPKNAAKTPIGHANSLCSVRPKFHAQSHCAYRIRILLACGHRAARSVHEQMPIANRRFCCVFGTLDPDFSSPKWPFLSVLFAKRSKMTPSFKIMQSWRSLELHA